MVQGTLNETVERIRLQIRAGTKKVNLVGKKRDASS